MHCSVLQAQMGQQKKLEESLQRLRGENTDVSKEANEIRVIV